MNMQEFVKICLMDKTLGDSVLKIFRAVISALWQAKSFALTLMSHCQHLGTWSFIFERWSSGMFFVQTKPPKGKFWDKLSETSFQTASFHSPSQVFIQNKIWWQRPTKIVFLVLRRMTHRLNPLFNLVIQKKIKPKVI